MLLKRLFRSVVSAQTSLCSCSIWIRGGDLRGMLLFVFAFFSPIIAAGPWIDSSPYNQYSNMAMKSDVELMASFGLIKAPTLTWPIAWVNVGPPLLREDAKNMVKTLPSFVQQAYFRLLKQYEIASSQNFDGAVFGSGGFNINPFRTFEWQPRSDGEGGISFQKQSNHFAGNLALNYGKYDDLTQDVHLDNSYLYVFLGNWGIGIDKMNRWWSPAYSDSMILSANAPPLPTVTLQRMKAEAFNSDWLSWIGPWTFTTSLSVGGKDVPEPHPLIWLTNITIKPLESLQFSVSRVSFFAGENRPLNSRMVWNLIKLDNNCSAAMKGPGYCELYSPGTEHWEATVSFDMFSALNAPIDLYLQTIFNDTVPRTTTERWFYNGKHLAVPGRTAFLAGGNFWTSIHNTLVRVFAEFEYTYQYVYYFWGEFAPNIYGYSKYPYVYQGKLLATPLGGEAKGYTLGGVFNEENGSSDTFLIRYLNLNEYNYQGYGYPFSYQKAVWLSYSKSFELPQNLGTLSGQIGYLKSVRGQGLNSAASGFIVWRHAFH